MRTGCLCSSAASLPVAPIRPAHPSHSHTQILRRRARCIRTLQLASEVSYSQLKVCAPVSPVSKSPAPGRVTPTGSCFPFQFRGQRLRVDPLTLHPPPLQARPCPSRHFPQSHPSPAQPCPAQRSPAGTLGGKLQTRKGTRSQVYVFTALSNILTRFLFLRAGT